MSGWLRFGVDAELGPYGPRPFAADVDLEAELELLEEWNERNERAAGATFRAVHVHGASWAGNPRHQPPNYPPPRHLWPTTTPNA